MKIFFSASIHGKAKFEENYKVIISAVQSLGYKIAADHILSYTPQNMAAMSEEEYLAYHKKVIDGIRQADVLFAEVSYSSTSVGYLISLAVQMGKPVVIFYGGKEEPHLFRTLESINDRLQIIRYESVEELKKEIPHAIDFVTSSQDTRFNFFISPDQSQYLDWIAKNKKISRSVYLRNLINQDMEFGQQD